MNEQPNYAIEGTTAIQLTPTPRLRLVFDAERDGKPTPGQTTPEAARPHGEKGRAKAAPLRLPHDTAQLLMASLVLVLAIIVASWVGDVLRASHRTSVLDVVPLCEMAVGPGDSLWTIAESHPVEGVSTPELVAWLKEANDLESSALGLGQTLSVPMSDCGPLPRA